MEHLREGVMSADEALQGIRGKVIRGKLPAEDEIEGCVVQLGLALATIKGSLTLPIDEPEPKKPPDPDPQPGLWYQRDAMA